MDEIVKHINDTNASYRRLGSGDAKNTDLFLDNEHYAFFEDSGEQITVRFEKENLQKAILFIASILPRKFDNSAIHTTINLSENFVTKQLAILNGFFMVEGRPVKYRTQVWNPRKNVPKKNGEIDNRFYFNGLLEDINYVDSDGNTKVSKFTVRNYLAGGYSDIHFKKNIDGVFDVWITNALTPSYDGKEDDIETISENIQPLQQIFYGAPGTGKSNNIKEQVDDKGAVHFRTTFHPDSDYSTFVGCYKPKSHKKNMLDGNGLNETQLLSKFFDSNSAKYNRMNKARYLYEALVHTKDIRDLGMDAQTVADKLNAQGFSGCAYTTEANCMYNIYDWLKEDGFIVENKISYEFTPQSFTNAYIEAWRLQSEGTPVYLIIEEINRGNCAQIFGDMFQLLDRDDDGYSRYEITPDSDLQDYISSCGLSISGILNSKGEDISASIASGEMMKLPNNLYIWATMNTSDQSLFPIDSAFKRRWDWVYIPIEDAGKGWKIKVNNNEYDWYAFLKSINNEVFDLTHSEDKQLGYFFAKAADGIIDAKTLVNKVYFYLWTDVFKDYEYESLKAFKKADGNGAIAFKDFFKKGGVDEVMAEQVLINLGLNKPAESVE